MTALDLLLNRQSHPLLADPAPSDEQVDVLINAALRAPDHAYLRPWRFIRVEGEARYRLGELFAEVAASDQPDLTEAQLEKTRLKPLRAPLLIVVVARIQAHPKVPQWEQLVSAGCAAHAILYAAQAMGFGAIWRTGAMAESAMVRQKMGLSDQEKIVGFIYLGTPVSAYRLKPELQAQDYLSEF